MKQNNIEHLRQALIRKYEQKMFPPIPITKEEPKKEPETPPNTPQVKPRTVKK